MISCAHISTTLSSGLRKTERQLNENKSRVGKGELHPQTSHRTVLDTLASYGSS